MRCGGDDIDENDDGVRIIMVIFMMIIIMMVNMVVISRTRTGPADPSAAVNNRVAVVPVRVDHFEERENT